MDAKKCPTKDCDATYRGSQCASQRSAAGICGDPLTQSENIRQMPIAMMAQALAAIAFGKNCTPEHIAMVSEWLATPKADNIPFPHV